MKKVVIVLLLVPHFAFAQQIMQTLKFDLQKNELSYEDYLVYRALAIYQPQSLPSKYSVLISDLPIKCGTFIISEIKFNWHRLTSENQSLLQPFLTRPELPYNVVSPSGKFRVHFTISGSEAVSIRDDNQNGIPDYVDHVIENFEYSHWFETDSLGYKAPPDDQGMGGGNEYDIYIQNFTMIYGQTVPETEVPDNPNTYSSYLEIDNNYVGFPTSGLNGLRVTAAHEYFHAIQMGYKFKGDDSFWDNEVFYFEISSTWMEDMIYDDINDYYFYMRDFFNNINNPFNTYNSSYEYGNCLWNHMLTKKYGHQIIRDIWEEIKNYPVLKAIDKTLSNIGSSFNFELTDYSIWNYFTGSRQDSINYYPEGAYYPEVTFALNKQFSSDTTIADSSSQSAFSYYNFYDTQYQNLITFIPLNIEPNSNLNPKLKFELSRHGLELFKPITDGLYARMIVDNYLRWHVNAVITNPDGNISLIEFSPIGEDNLSREKSVIGYYPNPFIINKHSKFTVDYQLKKRSSVSITIFSENGYKISKFSEPLIPSGVNHFDWNQDELGPFPGGSGIYLLLFETDYSKEVIKFAVLQ